MGAATGTSLGVSGKAEALDALRAQRARTILMLEDLPADAWERTVLPGWRVRELVAHLITSDEGALTGRMVRLGLASRPLADIEAWNDQQVGRWADRPIPALLAALDRWGSRLARVLALQPEALASRPLPTPFGRVSILWLTMLRVYDEWVHGEDLRRALGLPESAGPGPADGAAQHLLAALPVRTLPSIPPATTGQATLALREPDLPAVGVDLTARRFGPALAGAGTLIEATAAPLIMAAAGRDRWRDVEAAGQLRIDGDRGPAETLLDVLRF